jgi:eukaryotic-like serine/threonine-protein kinase
MSNARDGTDDTLPAPSVSASASTPIVSKLTHVYRLGDELGRGGMGRVVRATDDMLGRDVVIKTMLPSASNALRFEREARITARLQHPAIVPIYDLGKTDDQELFYVMRPIPGRSLEALLASTSDISERLKLLSRFLAAAEAIAFAHHHRVVHRDLKPANIMVGDFGETIVIDWGLAKELDERDAPTPADGPYREAAMPQLTADGAIMGTPMYMAPEQARGDAVDTRTDVYALGAILYELVTGQRPANGTGVHEMLARLITEDPPAIPDWVQPDLAWIIGKAMKKAPEERYESAAGIATDLRAFIDGRLVASRDYTTGDRAGRWLRRNWPFAAAVALVLASAGLAVHERQERVEALRKCEQLAR